jgi:hypothetical protein
MQRLVPEELRGRVLGLMMTLFTVANPLGTLAAGFLLHVLPAGFVKIRHFGLLANRNRSQALALCRIHLRATPQDITALLTEPQKSALNRSCPQCKRGTLHVVDHPLSRIAPSCGLLTYLDSS